MAKLMAGLARLCWKSFDLNERPNDFPGAASRVSVRSSWGLVHSAELAEQDGRSNDRPDHDGDIDRRSDFGGRIVVWTSDKARTMIEVHFDEALPFLPNILLMVNMQLSIEALREEIQCRLG
jgi:hypothetical protein